MADEQRIEMQQGELFDYYIVIDQEDVLSLWYVAANDDVEIVAEDMGDRTTLADLLGLIANHMGYSDE